LSIEQLQGREIIHSLAIFLHETMQNNDTDRQGLLGEEVYSASKVKATSILSPFIRIHENKWVRNVDWALYGYFVFCIGAFLHFLQSLAPFYPQMYLHHEDVLMGFAASVLYLIDSMIFVIGWYKDHKISLESGNGRDSASGETWNFWGNILFVIGSFGYLTTSMTALFGCCERFSNALNVLLSILFVIDSVVYMLGLMAGEISRAPRPEGAVALFKSSIDWYLLASLTYILGSVVYFFAAVCTEYQQDASVLNLVGGIIFIIDGPLFLISGLQYRDKQETPFANRQKIFSIERKL